MCHKGVRGEHVQHAQGEALSFVLDLFLCLATQAFTNSLRFICAGFGVNVQFVAPEQLRA